MAAAAGHPARVWTVTGPRALAYYQVADILTPELSRSIRYTRPSLLRYVQSVLGRDPIDFTVFAHRQRSARTHRLAGPDRA